MVMVGLAWIVGAAWAADPPAIEPEHAEKLRQVLDLEGLDDDKSLITDPSGTDRFDRARLAMTFGQYDVARQLLEPLADARPMDEPLQTNLGLAWMGEYYARYGLTEAAFTRVQGLAVDPAGALADGSPLRKDEIGLALARGFAIADASGVRGGSTLPEPLARAVVVLDHAYRIAPDEPRTLLHLFIAETESARWQKPDAALAERRAAIGSAMTAWPDDLRALALVDIGVYDYTVARDAKAALASFAAADKLGSPLGAYDQALLLACDPSFADRRGEAIARFERLGRSEASSPDRAVRAGLLPTATAWPYGAGSARLTSTAPEIAAYAAAIRGEDAVGTTRTSYGDLADVRLASGQRVLVDPGKTAWLVFAEPGADAVADAGPIAAPQAVDAPVLDGRGAEHVVVRLSPACLSGDPLAPRSPSGESCPMAMEVRLSE